VISNEAIEAFLNRPLAEYDWLKRATPLEVEAELASMAPVPDFKSFKNPPWLHQKICFLLLDALKRFLLLVDMGGGKSLASLMLLRYRKQCGEKIRAVVFVPYITSVETWIDEVEKHAPDLKCVPCLGTAAENLQRLQGDGDLFVICYQSAVAMLARFSGAKTDKGKWTFEAAQTRKCFKGINLLIMDEIHKIKNSQSLTYRMCRAISAEAEYAVGLTGTPFGKNLQDLWSQFYVIDFGETLGGTLGLYRGAFFKEKINYWGAYEYKFKRDMLPVLKQAIKNRSIRYEVGELFDMPPIVSIKRRMHAPDSSQGYILDALDKMKDAGWKGDYRGVENNYLQLRQLSSGFMTLRGEDTTKVHVRFKDNPKLEALTEIIEGMPDTAKIVIFHHFVYTNFLLSERLTEMKIKHARIWSGQRDPIGELRRFKQPSCRALIINSKSGSSSLNLQHANYVVFFEQPDSSIDRQQAERRVWRPGQSQRVMMFDLLVDGTVDARLMGANTTGKNLLKELFREARQPPK
jgi:SNF2 family DNA or RNA helicase